MQSKLNWDDARLFLAVSRSGQLLAAARALGLNQATLSRRMTALETDLGAQLLIRRTTGCDLTDAGRELLLSLEEQAEFLASEARLAGLDGSVENSIRIRRSRWIWCLIPRAALGVLAERHPRLHVQLVPVPRTFSLSQREADIAVMLERPLQGAARCT